jgi:hypothetical protein
MPKLKSLKKDIQTEKYFKLHTKFENIFKNFPKDKSFSAEDRQYLSFCLTELYFMSNHMNKVIRNISDTNLKIENKDLDSLISHLIELQVNTNIEIVDWIRNLKKPLKSLINSIENSDSEKSDFIARKNISISMKRINGLLKKMKY